MLALQTALRSVFWPPKSGKEKKLKLERGWWQWSTRNVEWQLWRIRHLTDMPDIDILASKEALVSEEFSFGFRRILFGFRIIPDIGSTKGSVGSRMPCLKGSILPRCLAQPGAIFTRYTKGVARIFETCSDGLDFCFGFLPSESNRQWPCDHDSLWFYGCSHRWARRWNPPVKMRRKKVMYRMQTHSQSCICHL